jgi:hypothetical protein
MNLDIIVAVLGIISAILGLLTAIIQLKDATHQRRHQESQDSRSYIDIGKWLKRALILFGVPFAILLVYREWDSVEKGTWKLVDFANKAVSYDLSFKTLDPIPVPVDLEGKFLVRIPDQSFSFRCTNGVFGNGSTTMTTCKDCKEQQSKKHGNIVLRIRQGNQEARSGEPLMLYKNEPVIAVISFDNRWENDILPQDRKSCRIIVAGSEGMNLALSFTPVLQ